MPYHTNSKKKPKSLPIDGHGLSLLKVHVTKNTPKPYSFLHHTENYFVFHFVLLLNLMVNEYCMVDFLSSMQPAQSESVYPNNIKLSPCTQVHIVTYHLHTLKSILFISSECPLELAITGES